MPKLYDKNDFSKHCVIITVFECDCFHDRNEKFTTEYHQFKIDLFYYKLDANNIH